MQSFWDKPPSCNNRIGCCGETASSEKLISVVHSSQMQHTEHKAQRKKRRLSICSEAGFRPPPFSYIYIYCDWYTDHVRSPVLIIAQGAVIQVSGNGSSTYRCLAQDTSPVCKKKWRAAADIEGKNVVTITEDQYYKLKIGA